MKSVKTPYHDAIAVILFAVNLLAETLWMFDAWVEAKLIADFLSRENGIDKTSEYYLSTLLYNNNNNNRISIRSKQND